MAVGWLLGAGPALGQAPSADQSPPDALAVLGYHVTGGAAPGYVEDRVCKLCHGELYRSYQEVGMARSFYRATPDRAIEDFTAGPFFHQPSQRYYVMEIRDGRYVFRRFQRDEADQPINVVEQEVDWILGSGNHSRTYLFRTEGGELYQLPLAWYSQSGTWRMAPGYDRPHHVGLQRQVRRECMFCHNAYPDVPEGSDVYGEEHVFPEDLPEGTGCQRCHGPGASHVRAAFAGERPVEEVRGLITNPARLAPRQRMDICYGCHMQPSVSLFGVRRFDRGDYSFRPGESLADYNVGLDVEEEGKRQIDRFEINHHPYRLQQSRCFRESAGKLDCLTCHDPHVKVPAAERAAHYRAKCLGCHDVPAGGPHTAGEGGDCVTCHMPERRTQDVIQVTMTDHLIRRDVGEEDLLAPLSEADPILVDAFLLDPERAPPGDLGEIYRTLPVLRATGGAHSEAMEHLERLLARVQVPEVAPFLDLAKAALRQRRFATAEGAIRAILERAPGFTAAGEWLGIARARAGRVDEGIELVREAVRAAPERSEFHFNLGALLRSAGRHEEAVPELREAVRLRPTLPQAWYRLGDSLVELHRDDEAVAPLTRALVIDPSYSEAYVALGEVLLRLDRRQEALRYLRHGVRVAREPEMVEAVLKRVAQAAEQETGEPQVRWQAPSSFLPEKTAREGER